MKIDATLSYTVTLTSHYLKATYYLSGELIDALG
jgi:hypothetical protein